MARRTGPSAVGYVGEAPRRLRDPQRCRAAASARL